MTLRVWREIHGCLAKLAVITAPGV